MKRFCFTDSSGILKSDRFFGTGLLVIKNIGDLNDKLNKNAQPVKALVKENKNKAIQDLLAVGKKDEVINILRGNYRFEMKFDHISNGDRKPYYKNMIDIFLADSDNRFSAMVVDKEHKDFNNNELGDAWETYTKYIAMLVATEMAKLSSNDELCLVVDEISKPQTKTLSLEDAVLSKLRDHITNISNLDFNKIFGCFSIESHSNMPMQLCDVLLGSVMYDYKKQAGLTSERTEIKKEDFVSNLRKAFSVDSLAKEFTFESKAYFNVFECSQ